MPNDAPIDGSVVTAAWTGITSERKTSSSSIARPTATAMNTGIDVPPVVALVVRSGCGTGRPLTIGGGHDRAGAGERSSHDPAHSRVQRSRAACPASWAPLLPNGAMRRCSRESGPSFALATAKTALLRRGILQMNLDEVEAERLDPAEDAVQRRLVGQAASELRVAAFHPRLKTGKRAEKPLAEHSAHADRISGLSRHVVHRARVACGRMSPHRTHRGIACGYRAREGGASSPSSRARSTASLRRCTPSFA